MAKRRKDPIREQRIHDEAIVDAYGPEEQAMGWYYYLENKIRFPFQAKCIGVNPTSPVRKGERPYIRGTPFTLLNPTSIRSSSSQRRNARECKLESRVRGFTGQKRGISFWHLLSE